MERKALKDKDLIPAIGSKTTVSLVLNRKRALTIEIYEGLTVRLKLKLGLRRILSLLSQVQIAELFGKGGKQLPGIA